MSCASLLVGYAAHVLWLSLAAVALLVTFLLRRNSGGTAFNGLDRMRDLVDRHHDLSRAIAVERVRAKDSSEPNPESSIRVTAMEQKRKELGDSIQRLRTALVRRGFGVGNFWLPSVEQFEAEALEEHTRAKAGTNGS